MLPRLLILLTPLVLLAFCYTWLAGVGYLGNSLGPGVIHPHPRPVEFSAQNAWSDAEPGLDPNSEKQILFGDLHVHTTYSNDAFLASLPLSAGEGAHPPADACDYARYCSALDFWSINDHAVSLNQTRWRDIKQTIRQCNAVTSAENPDLVSFLGYEWTQADPLSAATHYGHKNVIFQHTEEDQVPERPIYAETELGPAAFNPPLVNRMLLPLQKWSQRQTYLDWNRFMAEMESEPDCPDGISSAALPADCKEGARTPADLFRKLDEAGFTSMVIPHGNTWGLYTPPGTTWDKQLAGDMQNEKYQNLIEVFSGHGNSEEYRDWRGIGWDNEGKPYCPPARPDYLPLCVQAGRLIRARCLQAGEEAQECDRRELLAQRYAAESAVPMATVPRSEPNEWLDSGQCKDCYLPAYTYRPGGSSQYALALGNFDDPNKVRRFRFGFIASSDNHTARPGTGYKERDRMHNVEGFAVADPELRKFMTRSLPEALPFSVPIPPQTTPDQALMMSHVERGSSFFLTGGLVAVHTNGRTRDAIWQSLGNRETYGTSGDRILLWFDLLNAGPRSSTVAPMGSELSLSHTPRFRVRAAGAFKQKPGCPDYATTALGADRLQRLCYGECYHPDDERKLITRIEVIRIRPQRNADENIDGLIEDVWLRHDCPVDTNGCSFEFEDPEFVAADRETVYYVRAIEEASPAVNAALMRCKYDEAGNCTEANICAASPQFTEAEDDCLAPSEERAWSSPIFITPGATPGNPRPDSSRPDKPQSPSAANLSASTKRG